MEREAAHRGGHELPCHWTGPGESHGFSVSLLLSGELMQKSHYHGNKEEEG